MYLEYIGIAFILVTALVATICYRRYKNTPLKYIVYYLWIPVILEFGAYPIYDYSMYWYQVWYNVGVSIEILFYLFLFHQYIEAKLGRLFVIVGGILYLLYFFINSFFFSDANHTSQIYPITFGTVVVIITVFIFILEMFKSDKVLYFSKYLIFWISIGLLFYNIIPLPYYVSRYFLVGEEEEILNFMMGIQYSASILMHLSFIYGFIWSSMNYKSL